MQRLRDDLTTRKRRRGKRPIAHGGDENGSERACAETRRRQHTESGDLGNIDAAKNDEASASQRVESRRRGVY
jgi:hypothetical protein